MGGTDLLAIAICAEKSPYPSIQSTVGHLSAVEQICRLHILKLQHRASTLTTLAQKNNCIAHLFF
ncbi:hypothetical protein [Nostoc sp. C110]|uniref:hypothetical protein n=1 Tax=Nostoc sp. C110 TaxID=3349876 RepID=UPI00370D3F4F